MRELEHHLDFHATYSEYSGARATVLQCSTWLPRTRRGVALGQVPAHRTDCFFKGPAAAGGGGLTSGDFMRQNRGIIVV